MKMLKQISTFVTALATIAILIMVFADELKHDDDKLSLNRQMETKEIEPKIVISDVVAATDFDKGLKATQSGEFKTALAQWAPLAEEGHAWAQYNLGRIYSEGHSVPKNNKTALKWYTLAADQGHARAQSNLGVLYDLGLGILENNETAVKLYTLAAEQGNAIAQSNLGTMYDHGNGVSTNYERAYMWYNLAAYNGDPKGAENNKSIAKEMTPVQIAKAQEMSSRCLLSEYTDC